MAKEYRVFISYSHKDREKVNEIEDILKANHLRLMSDANFIYGGSFHVQIKNFISCSHVFMPFITDESSTRGWVHQEIGYTIALDIPVLPITLDLIPVEMLQHLLAVSYTDNMEELRARLSIGTFERLVNKAVKTSRPQYYCEELPEDRTEMMIEYSTMVLGYHGMVCQKDGEHFRANRCHMQRQERQALEKHVSEAGCRLIVNPYLNYKQYGPKAKYARLTELVEFLKSSSANIEIVAVKPKKSQDYLTIVGDWFAAQAIAANMMEGIKHTIFTCHAHSIESQIELCDEEFNSLLTEMGVAPEKSKIVALEMFE
ncbi:MAG: toll/interleukin-1 receptor domain-containing protein [Pseudomonadota bacterium]